ncbi:unnamed protein product [Prunus armeniaca]
MPSPSDNGVLRVTSLLLLQDLKMMSTFTKQWILSFSSLPLQKIQRRFSQIFKWQQNFSKEMVLQNYTVKFSFNYNWIFAISFAFNLTNLKNRGYLDEELGGQEKSRTTQEQGNS